VQIGGVAADRRQDIRLSGGAESEMTAEADAERPEATAARRMRPQAVERSAGVCVGDGIVFRFLSALPRSVPAGS
jgi:hypothetical protein